MFIYESPTDLPKEVKSLLGKQITMRQCIVNGSNSRLYAAPGTPIGYDPEKQAWEDWGDYRVGMWLDNKPGPSHLAKSNQYISHPVTMCDGNEWLFPVARVIHSGVPMPGKLRLGKGGDVQGKPLQEFLDYCDLATNVLQDVVLADETDYQQKASDDQIMQLAYNGLCLNYRVGYAELNLLGLFDTSVLAKSLEAVMDLVHLGNKKKV